MSQKIAAIRIISTLSASLTTEDELHRLRQRDKHYRAMCKRLRECAERNGLVIGEDYIDQVIMAALDKALTKGKTMLERDEYIRAVIGAFTARMQNPNLVAADRKKMADASVLDANAIDEALERQEDKASALSFTAREGLRGGNGRER